MALAAEEDTDELVGDMDYAADEGPWTRGELQTLADDISELPRELRDRVAAIALASEQLLDDDVDWQTFDDIDYAVLASMTLRQLREFVNKSYGRSAH